MKELSNSEVARQAGVHPVTLERWLATGELPWPKVLVMGCRVVRLWKEADIERIRRYKAKNGAKTRSRKNHCAPCVEGDEQFV